VYKSFLGQLAAVKNKKNKGSQMGHTKKYLKSVTFNNLVNAPMHQAKMFSVVFRSGSNSMTTL